MQAEREDAGVVLMFGRARDDELVGGCSRPVAHEEFQDFLGRIRGVVDQDEFAAQMQRGERMQHRGKAGRRVGRAAAGRNDDAEQDAALFALAPFVYFHLTIGRARHVE